MTSTPLDLARTLALKADHDIQAVELLMNEGATDVICFHLQQAAEKILKAYLQANSVDFPRTHDLDALLDICSENTDRFEPYRIVSKYSFPMLSCFVMTWTMSRRAKKRALAWFLFMKSAQV
jgi:hypothetical protein